MDFFDEIIKVLEKEKSKNSRASVEFRELEAFFSNKVVKPKVVTAKETINNRTSNAEVVKSTPANTTSADWQIDEDFSKTLARNMQFPREVTANSFDEINQLIMNCSHCDLSKTRQNIVLGRGNLKARLMFIGETPSVYDDTSGMVFSGDIGELLDKMIQAMGFESRNDIYLTNAIKCRPPANRVVNLEELNGCINFLKKEIELVQPEVIVAFGAAVVKYLTGKVDTITNLRGKFLSYNNIRLMPTFSPAYLIKKSSAKREVWQDLQEVMKVLGLK